MRITLWIVFACLASVTESMYRFRYHTCIADDQHTLEKENLLSLNQVLFIDDGSLSYHNVSELDKLIRIESGSALGKLTENYVPGGESALRVVLFNNSRNFIVVNFWTQTYHLMKRKDSYSLDSLPNPIKPDLSHFIRVYFVCAPGNARSALILFGPQAKLRKKSEAVAAGKTATGGKSRTARDVKVKHLKTEALTGRDKTRLSHRARLRLKLNLSFFVVGFGIASALNGLILIFFLKTSKKGKEIVKKEDKNHDKNTSESSHK